MPKFLDAPSWYDENGTLTTVNQYAQKMSGYKSIKYLGGGSYSAFAYSGNYGPTPPDDLYFLRAGTSNDQILTWNNGYPQWSNASDVVPTPYVIYFHNASGGTPATNSVSFLMFFDTTPNISDMYDVRSIVQSRGQQYSIFGGFVGGRGKYYPTSMTANASQITVQGISFDMSGTSTPVPIQSNTFNDYTVICKSLYP